MYRNNRYDRSYPPQFGSRLTQMAEECLLALGCGLIYMCLKQSHDPEDKPQIEAVAAVSLS